MGRIDVSGMVNSKMELSIQSRRKVLFVVSEDYYFISHRLELAKYLRSSGWDVIVATQINNAEGAERIIESNLRLVPIALKRGSLFAISDLVYLFKLIALYWREAPDIVHHVAMKPVLWGSIAALVCRCSGVVNALAGLGYLFTSRRPLIGCVRFIVGVIFRILFNRDGTLIILQNREDMDELRKKVGVQSGNLRLIRGAGVDVRHFAPVVHQPKGVPVVVMVSRMLRDKGVAELVAAACAIKDSGVATDIRIVGGVDSGNPNSFTKEDMLSFQRTGAITWLGHRADVKQIYGSADIAVLPSYREGLPKTLLEAAASGLPIVTTNTSGCREVVADGVNGFLVPVRDSASLAMALKKLILDWQLRAQFGRGSRGRVENEFRQELVWAQTASVYDELRGLASVREAKIL